YGPTAVSPPRPRCWSIGPTKEESPMRYLPLAAILLAASLAGLGPAAASDYPNRPVKWIVPYPPGGTTDVLARIIAQWLTEKMGQSFVIENKAGGGNNIGTEL